MPSFTHVMMTARRRALSLGEPIMSLSNTAENDVVGLLFNATALNAAYTGNLYVSLHTADPGEAGTQSTSEAAYTSYARATVARTSGGFTVSGNVASNTAIISFPEATGGTAAITHVGIGTSASGAGRLIASGAVTPTVNVATGVTVSFAAGALTFTLD